MIVIPVSFIAFEDLDKYSIVLKIGIDIFYIDSSEEYPVDTFTNTILLYFYYYTVPTLFKKNLPVALKKSGKWDE